MLLDLAELWELLTWCGPACGDASRPSSRTQRHKSSTRARLCLHCDPKNGFEEEPWWGTSFRRKDKHCHIFCLRSRREFSSFVLRPLLPGSHRPGIPDSERVLEQCQRAEMKMKYILNITHVLPKVCKVIFAVIEMVFLPPHPQLLPVPHPQLPPHPQLLPHPQVHPQPRPHRRALVVPS